jgi:hypothetical protein
MVTANQDLECFPWSSYPAYRHAKLRPIWLRVDRLLGEHGLQEDNAATRREFERRMIAARLEPDTPRTEQSRQEWKLGAEDFGDWLAGKLSRRGKKGERAKERSETDAALAERMVQEALAAVRWREIDLAMQSKGHSVKVEIARCLRKETPMSRQWIAQRLKMGSASYVSNLLSCVNSKL